MVPTAKIEFVMQSLEIKSTDIAKYCELSPAHVSNILSGRDNPSLPVALKIDEYLRIIWAERKGATRPPEVEQIIRDILYPKAPFDPGEFKGRKATSHPKNDAGGDQLTESTNPLPQQKAAHNVAPTPQGGLVDSVNYSARPLEIGHAEVPQPSRQDPQPAPAAIGFRRWNRSELTDRHYAARTWYELTDDIPGVTALRDQLLSDIKAAMGTWLPEPNEHGEVTRGAIRNKLRRASPHRRLRQRGEKTEARCAELAQRRRTLSQYTLDFAAAIESVPHSKGAYGERAWMDLRATLLGCYDRPEFQAEITKIYGHLLSYSAFERIFRAEFGAVSPVERAAERYDQATIGKAPDYCGQYMQIDGSELPITVLSGWGRARNDGDIAYPFGAILDQGSLKSWLEAEGNTSEVYLWDPLLLKFYRSANYAPERLLSDRGGRLWRGLEDQHAGEPLNLYPGLRLTLAVGCEPAMHLPHAARTKGGIEAGAMKAGKSVMKRLLVGKYVAAIFRELKDVPPNYRTLTSEASWRELMSEWEQALNARTVKRVGDGTYTRQGAWDLPQYVAKRNERRLAADWEARYPDIIRRGFCMAVRGENTLYWKGARAQLLTPLGRKLDDKAVAILFPGGLRAGDEQYGDELLRGVVIEPSKGLPTFTTIQALKVKKTFLGFDSDRINQEHPIAVPETEHDRRRRSYIAAGKVLPAAVLKAKADAADERRLKTGTADEYV